MAIKSGIAWTTSTFNPWIGCTKIGPGCDSCYAESQDSRKRWGGKTHWGTGVPRHRTSASYWKNPLQWNRHQERLIADAMASGTTAEPWRVFCASLADVFDNEVSQEWRDDLWRLTYETPNLSWLLVTKRIGNVPRMVPAEWLVKFPDNVRLMITVANKEDAYRDINKLLCLPCKNGISYEPAVEAVNFSCWLKPIDVVRPDPNGRDRHIEWLIVGGESGQGGHKPRLFDIQWARDVVTQCRDAGVAAFVKQLGSDPRIRIGDTDSLLPYAPRITDRAGADPAEWPEDLRVREFPI